MTPHQLQNFLDGSQAVRIYQGGPWTVTEGWDDCAAQEFVDAQNKWIDQWHQKSVKGYLGVGEPA